MRHEITIATNIGSPKESKSWWIIESCPALKPEDKIIPIFVDDISKTVSGLIMRTLPFGISNLLSWAASKGINKLRELPVSVITHIDNEGREQFKIITKFE